MSKTSKEVVTLKGLLPLSFLQHSPHALAIRNNINTIVDVVLCEMVVISNDQQKERETNILPGSNFNAETNQNPISSLFRNVEF